MREAPYNRIKVVLVEKQKTNRQLAEYLNVGPVTVSRWCTNDSQPSIKTLFEIAGFLKVEVSSLLADWPKEPLINLPPHKTPESKNNP